MGYALSVIFFFVTARHRLPAVPLVACLAGFAAVYLIRLLKFWNVRQVFTSFGLFSLCFAFTNLNPALGQRSASGAEKKNWFGVDDEYLDFASQHNNMAALLLERGDAKEAEQECRQGLALKPQHSTLLFNLARSFAGEERLSEAKTAAEQSLKNSPNNAIVFAFLGDLCYKTGDFAGARQALEAALRLAPSNAGAWNTLGPTLYKLGDSEGCIAALRRAEVLAPGWFEPAYNRGILLSHLGRYPEAITLFDSLHRNNAGNRPATLALAEALSGAKRFDQAGQLLNAFLAKAPNDTGGLLLLAEINLKQKKPKDARLLVLRVLTMNPNNTRALTFLQACKKMEARATVKN